MDPLYKTINEILCNESQIEELEEAKRDIDQDLFYKLKKLMPKNEDSDTWYLVRIFQDIATSVRLGKSLNDDIKDLKAFAKGKGLYEESE